MGAVTPIGNDVAAFSRGIFSGEQGAAPLKRFDASRMPTCFGAEVKGLDGEFRDVKITFALKAAREAMAQANRPPGLDRAGLSIGLGLELFSMEDLVHMRLAGGWKRSETLASRKQALTFLNTPSDLCAHLIGKEFSFNRAPQIHISACAAGTDAIGSAYRAIAEGRLDFALAGGADSMVNPMGLGGFCRIGALSTRNDSPETASRPFDRTRDGFVLGEGAGFLALEEESAATARGAKILGRICGYGNSLDAYSLSDPHPGGAGAHRAMVAALRDAGIAPEELSAVSAHGTSTPKNDPAESAAIRTLLGAHWKNVPVFSTKSMIGHLISAAGAVETIAAVESIRLGKVHATANLRDPSDDCELRHVMDKAIDHPSRYILKNSFGFGGQNACIVIGGV
jgi:3-oxoacyl-(acyl-carrier-protein) synthase